MTKLLTGPRRALCVYALVFGACAQAADLYTDFATWSMNAPGAVTTETFPADIASADSIVFASGITSVGTSPMGTRENEVEGTESRWNGRVRHTANGDGYPTIVWTFPAPVRAFAVDIESISSSRGVAISGDFDGSGTQTVGLFDFFGDTSNGFFGVVGNATFSAITFDIIESDPGTTVMGNDFFRATQVYFDDGTPVDLEHLDIE